MGHQDKEIGLMGAECLLSIEQTVKERPIFRKCPKTKSAPPFPPQPTIV